MVVTKEASVKRGAAQRSGAQISPRAAGPALLGHHAVEHEQRHTLRPHC